MAPFGKTFFNFPPNDPEEPGFQQDSNRSLRESHSTGKEITEFLSHYDDETITSLDGKKYNVLASREGSDEVASFWAPTVDLKEMQVEIAEGLVTAPYDNREGGSESDGLKQIFPIAEYHSFLTDPENMSLRAGKNFYFLKAEFSKREYEATSYISFPHSHETGAGYDTFEANFDWKVFSYHITGKSKISIVREENRNAFTGSDTKLNKYQFLGEIEIKEKKIKSMRWRTGHAIDFRMPTVTMLVEGATPGGVQEPDNPNG